MKTAKGILFALTLCIALPALTAITGCDSWERTTFNTLASSKAVLDQAQKDYEPPPVGTGQLPHNRCAYTLINDGKAAQTTAVTALESYDSIVAAKGNTAAQEATVIADLASLAPIVVQVKTLYSNPAAACMSLPVTPAPTTTVTQPSIPTSSLSWPDELQQAPAFFGGKYAIVGDSIAHGKDAKRTS